MTSLRQAPARRDTMASTQSSKQLRAHIEPSIGVFGYARFLVFAPVAPPFGSPGLLRASVAQYARCSASGRRPTTDYQGVDGALRTPLAV